MTEREKKDEKIQEQRLKDAESDISALWAFSTENARSFCLKREYFTDKLEALLQTNSSNSSLTLLLFRFSSTDTKRFGTIQLSLIKDKILESFATNLIVEEDCLVGEYANNMIIGEYSVIIYSDKNQEENLKKHIKEHIFKEFPFLSDTKFFIAGTDVLVNDNLFGVFGKVQIAYKKIAYKTSDINACYLKNILSAI